MTPHVLQLIDARAAVARREPLAPADPRWALASAASARLVGSMLRPHDRAALVRMGRAVGLDAFASNLVIAVVQDAARQGVCLSEAVDQLAMVPAARQRKMGTGLAVAAGVGLVLTIEAAVLALWLM